MRLSPLVSAVVLLTASLAAHADSFDFTFGNSSSLFSGSGVLTTGALEAPGEYPIVTVTGNAATAPNGLNLVISSILAPGIFPTPANGGSFPANDNTLFVNKGIGSLDGNGLSFILSNGAQINLYNPGGFANDALLKPASGPNVSESVSITITAVAPTPEPSTFALLGTGLLAGAGVAKRRLA